MMKNESGRSMVEMLGVLAIIGVLSIGGIAGYTLAMNRYRANEILNAASMVAIGAMTANGGAGVTDAAGWDLEDAHINVPACISAAGNIHADRNGQTTIVVDIANCADVGTLVGEIAGAKVTSGDCGAAAGCVLDMGNR